MPSISVIMPTFKQESFIRRALDSLLGQTLADWELWIVDDGSPDKTTAAVAPFLQDQRIHYQRLERNGGMGFALNVGLEHATGDLIAYLPSDDNYYPEHLVSLREWLEENPSAIAAFSGVRYHYNCKSRGQIEGYPLQLVQVMHRKTDQRWMERDELVTDDLERMFWSKLRPYGAFLETGQVSCEWVAHPGQRHKLLREPEGGINPYRQVIFTGPVDEYFNYRFGRLPYRSIEFQFRTFDEERRQPVAVINYPNEHAYTRVTEFKHLTGQEHRKTSLVYEFPCSDGDPYYPIPRQENAELYQKYKALAESTPGVHFAGRLGTYRYYNMDQVTAQALNLYTRIMGMKKGEALQSFTAASFQIDAPCPPLVTQVVD